MYVDEVDVDEQGIAEMLMDDNAVAQLPSLLLYVFFLKLQFSKKLLLKLNQVEHLQNLTMLYNYSYLIISIPNVVSF